MSKINKAALRELQDAHAKGIVKGLEQVAGVVPRLDVDILLDKHPKTFNLFLLALEELQDDTDTKNRMGYFQMAAIHGAPRGLWDQMGHKLNEKANEKGEYDQSGYCHHSLITFPTWHRPYLSMMEQTIYLKIVEIAERYSDEFQAEYLNAAQEFRLPFWDYYRPRGGKVDFPGVIDNEKTSFPYDYRLPTILTAETVVVRLYPDNKLRELHHNPLRSYKFHGDSFPEDEWKKFAEDPLLFPRDRTARYLVPGSKGTKEEHEKLNKVMNELRMDSNRLVLTMMEDQSYSDFEVFATNNSGTPTERKPLSKRQASTKVWGAFKATGSLEALHGLYHDLIGGPPSKTGGGGHMSMVAIAAFDPVFWLHHCQIDRLFAIWQAIHEGTEKGWFYGRYAGLAKDGLMPFRKTEGNTAQACWNSTQSRKCDNFGYTYPELGGKASEVLNRFNKMYEWSVPLKLTDPFDKIPDDMRPLDLSNSKFFASEKPKGGTTLSSRTVQKPLATVELPILPANAPAIQAAETAEYSREWYIDDEVERLALNGAFTIYYFLMSTRRSLPTNADFVLEPALAGLTHIFAAPRESCDQCGAQEEESLMVTNTVPITSLLFDYIKKGELQSLEAEHVTPFLEDGLKWRIVSVDGTIQDASTMSNNKGFRIGISCKVARLPRHSEHVTYEDYPDVIKTIISRSSGPAAS